MFTCADHARASEFPCACLALVLSMPFMPYGRSHDATLHAILHAMAKMRNIAEVKLDSACETLRATISSNFSGWQRWLEIVSWRVRPGPLIARVRASKPGSRRCKFSDLVPSKILQNLYFDRKYL